MIGIKLRQHYGRKGTAGAEKEKAGPVNGKKGTGGSWKGVEGIPLHQQKRTSPLKVKLLELGRRLWSGVRVAFSTNLPFQDQGQKVTLEKKKERGSKRGHDGGRGSILYAST